MRRLRCPVETSIQNVLPDAHDHRHAHLPAQRAPRPALGQQLVAQHELELELEQRRAAPMLDEALLELHLVLAPVPVLVSLPVPVLVLDRSHRLSCVFVGAAQEPATYAE